MSIFRDGVKFPCPFYGVHFILGLQKDNNSVLNVFKDALFLEGEKEPASLKITILSVPYDNHEAAERADLYPDLPKKESYQKEVLTGVYSR